MALNNTTADALATQICTALGITDTPSQTKMRDQWRVIYAKLKADIQVTITVNAITTTGTAATQSGPTVPVNINPN